jgi:general nucleoside transport system ATP-binding protein
VYALTGLRPPAVGTVRIGDSDVSRANPRTIIEKGVAHVPEDRQRHGLVLSFPVADNIALNTYYLPPFARGVNLQEEAILTTSEELIEQFDVRTPNVQVNVSTLSGGNQQKVIIAREFSRPTKLLIAAQPTRGLDVGSIEYIHSRIIQKRDEGTAVVVVSSELDEIMALSDRIAVMYKGQILDIVPAIGVSREHLGLLMAGIKPAEGVIAAQPAGDQVKIERVF